MNKAKEVTKLVRRARRALKLNGEKQQSLLRRARAKLNVTNSELAEALGVKLPTLYAYLAPSSAAKHRPLPEGLRLVLERILAEHGAARRK